MAKDDSKQVSEKKLFARLLQTEFGLSATVGVGMQLLNAYETYQDIHLDIQRFFDRKREFEIVGNVLNDINPIKNQLETLGKNADPGTLKKMYVIIEYAKLR